MKIRIQRLAGFMAMGLLLGSPATASEYTIQLSLLPDLQLVDREDDIRGIRLGFLTENQNVHSAELGLVNLTRGNYTGIGFGVMNVVYGEAFSLHVGTLNYAKTSRGVQYGAANCAGRNEGIQIGFYNHASENGFLQAGIVNHASNDGGFQVGLLNIDTNPDARFPAMVFINGSF